MLEAPWVGRRPQFALIFFLGDVEAWFEPYVGHCGIMSSFGRHLSTGLFYGWPSMTPGWPSLIPQWLLLTPGWPSSTTGWLSLGPWLILPRSLADLPYWTFLTPALTISWGVVTRVRARSAIVYTWLTKIVIVLVFFFIDPWLILA